MKIASVTPFSRGATVHVELNNDAIVWITFHDTLLEEVFDGYKGVSTVINNIDRVRAACWHAIAWRMPEGSRSHVTIDAVLEDFTKTVPPEPEPEPLTPEKMMLHYGAKALCNAVLERKSQEEIDNIANNVLLALNNFPDTTKTETDIAQCVRIVHHIIEDGWELELSSESEEYDGNEELAMDIVAALDDNGML